MELILISAMTRDRVIGRDNDLPWKIPEEYQMFLGHVKGHPIIMGRTSYQIFGTDLRASKLIVVSSTLGSLPDADVCPGVEEAVRTAGSYGDRVFSAGGATIYRQTLPMADTLYLSIIKRDYEGDTRFPELDEGAWEVARREDHAEFEFRVYERKKP